MNGTGSFIYWYYPKVLDFTKKNDISIYYYSHFSADDINGFTYNQKEEDLHCETFAYHIKKCYVTKEHFKGQNNGLYFLKHTNNLDKKSISYEIPNIRVILTSSSKGTIISLPLFY